MTSIYSKYTITKVDGSETNPNAEYFVLRLDTDRHAQAAVLEYARSVASENPELAEDIRQLINWIEEKHHNE